MNPIKPIKNEQDYVFALEEIDKIFNAKPNTLEGDTLEILSLLIHEYEQKHYKIEALSPLEAIKLEMAEKGLTQSNLAQNFGMSKSTISEIMKGKKQMSVQFMKFVHRNLGIPAHILLA